jgi:hypothetical protein
MPLAISTDPIPFAPRAQSSAAYAGAAALTANKTTAATTAAVRFHQFDFIFIIPP